MDVHNINNERIAELAFKYLLRQLTDEEKEELDKWIAVSAENEARFRELTDRTLLRSKVDEYNQFDEERIWGKIVGEVPEVDVPIIKRNKNIWFRVSMAAAMLVIILLGGWLYMRSSFNDKKGHTAETVTTTKDISPGGNKAILTLSDGSQVVLDRARHGVLAEQGKTSISKKREGEVIYNAKTASLTDHSPLTYNTITTPRGGQYHVVLPDGSHVWLNAASSIYFPAQFTGKERGVRLSGEAYFEVAPDKSRPFTISVAPVESEQMATIQVLGTHFNVSAYADENYINATLLEGRIKFASAKATNTPAADLKPGQQVVLSKQAEKVSVTNAEDAEVSISWVKGIFHFEKANISDVMRQLSRWYNVDVVYEGKIPEQKITGDAERNIPLSTMLQTLEKMASVQFQIQGRIIKVKP